ncbi:hypothetical protein ACRDU6_26370 [Mycolicibacterium sp. ELW1]|uniref:hypothetical protein n=1 Tax=Mycobacteriaceae TaxID=1762 RepID=UPI0011EDFB51|nr:hypothetical protein [Mycobacterium sp. ELW1]QEN15742.1 hypothetical protein D3H54_22890 [Mycobacterium sp. ELW1]
MAGNKYFSRGRALAFALGLVAVVATGHGVASADTGASPSGKAAGASSAPTHRVAPPATATTARSTVGSHGPRPPAHPAPPTSLLEMLFSALHRYHVGEVPLGKPAFPKPPRGGTDSPAGQPTTLPRWT